MFCYRSVLSAFMGKTLIRRFRTDVGQFVAFSRQYVQWRHIITTIPPYFDSQERLVIVPCDPWTVGGSRGDEAMLMAVMQQYRLINPQVPIIVVVSDESGCEYVRNLPIENITALPVWNGSYPLSRIYHGVLAQKPSHVVLLGADCMDGHYSPLLSLTLLNLHDLFSRTPGIESRLLGFSFNDKPYRPLYFAFDHIGDATIINLRDPVSYDRFRRKVSIHAGLVADAAFMLQPDYHFEGFKRLESWIRVRREIGKRIVIGFNFHPMLRNYSGVEEIKSDALVLAHNLERILQERPDVDFVLIPHDNRSRLTDNLMLEVIYSYLCQKQWQDRLYYDAEVYRAPQLKAICSLIDGLISSRMHLAIAALGQGKSVMAASYQGKFEGLFQHFKLPETYLLNPDAFISDAMIFVFYNYLNYLEELTNQVKKMLPSVVRLSQKNLL